MASDVDALCERIRQLPSARDPASVGRAVLDVRAALEARDRRIEELRDRADRLRLVLVRAPTYRKRCHVCACTWRSGEDEAHDADCIAAPTVKL